MSRVDFYKYLALVSGAICLRSIISLHSYSGLDKPPMFGDFEAQRHWQEITVNLPIKDWYENTTDNDLLYWGLDYPPLTAYHSFIMGLVGKQINEGYVELHKSRGITEELHKNFMRNTVMIADILIYIPSLLIICHIIFKRVMRMSNHRADWFLFIYLAIAILYPGQILIDNGHFQYNNISLGLAVFAVACILINRRILGAIFFVLALNYKQMELYHAMPIFCYLLSNCFIDPDERKKFGLLQGLFRLITLGLVVVAVFVVLWLPWLGSLESLLQVVHRIFPLNRGIFEDKVSNIWCIVNVFFKIKEMFSNQEMARMCLACTATALVPSAFNLLLNPKRKKLLYALFNSSMAFFLFSFQVHEKSILIPAVSAILLFPMDPFMVLYFLHIATFSMFPLLAKDGLQAAFIGLSDAFLILVKLLIDKTKDKQNGKFSAIEMLWKIGDVSGSSLFKKLMVLSFYISIIIKNILIFGMYFVPPPDRLPFLYPLLISAFSCCHFVFFFIYFNEVVDESDGCGGKFRAVIVSEDFAGKSLLQRHRLVNSALQEELKTIHAFSQQTYTPEQWETAQSK